MAVIRRRRRRRRSFGRFFRGLIFLVVSAAVLGFFVYVPFFTLSEIKLVGAKYLTQEDIMKIGNIYMGEQLFRLETDVVQSRLSKDLRIEEVTVCRTRLKSKSRNDCRLQQFNAITAISTLTTAALCLTVTRRSRICKSR